MLVIILMVFAATVSGEIDIQRQRWITSTLFDTLENYTPDGGSLCKHHGQEYRNGLKDLKLWATQMYDSSSKFPTGILSGKSVDFGDYDECLETNTTGLGFKPQYCVVNVYFSPSIKLYPTFYNDKPPMLNSSVPVWEAVKQHRNPAKVQRNKMSIAICIPSSCTHSDIQSTLSPRIASAFNEQEIYTTVEADSTYCTIQDVRAPKSLGFIIFWCFILIIVVFIIIGTLYDLYPQKDVKLKHKSIFIAFSISTNINRLIYNGTKTEEYACIDFLKVLSCLIVLLGHRLLYISSLPLYNTNKVEETYEILVYGIVRNGPLIVDIFFLVSGFLMFIGVYNELTKTKKLNMLFLLLWRWCRIIPLYGVMIAVHSFVLAHLSDGPLWKKLAFQETENCQKNWWTNVLFINNYVNVEQPCMIQSWYMACDIHLYTMGTLIVYFIWKFPKYGKYIMLVTLFVSCSIPAYIVYENKFYPTFFGFISTLKHLSKNEIYTLLYVPTHTRSTSYFVGMLASYIYQLIKNNKLKYRCSYPKTCLCALFSACLLWMMTIHYFFVHEYNLWMSVIYAFSFRLIFAALVSVSLVICTINALIKGIWSSILAPLSRLTYGAYLGGLSAQLYHVASTRSPTYYDPVIISWTVIGDTIYGFVIAFLLYMLIEGPFENLLKQMVNRLKTGKQITKEQNYKDIEMMPHRMEQHDSVK